MLWVFVRIPQHMFLWRNKQNYPLIITKNPPYLFHWFLCIKKAVCFLLLFLCFRRDPSGYRRCCDPHEALEGWGRVHILWGLGKNGSTNRRLQCSRGQSLNLSIPDVQYKGLWQVVLTQIRHQRMWHLKWFYTVRIEVRNFYKNLKKKINKQDTPKNLTLFKKIYSLLNDQRILENEKNWKFKIISVIDHEILKPYLLLQVAKPRVGEGHPAQVRADVNVTLSVVPSIKAEWEGR